MSNTFFLILIIIGIITLVIIYKWLKPYILRYNTTICITGELGAGKTLTAVKLAKILIKKARFKVLIFNKIKAPIINKIRASRIKRAKKRLQKKKITQETYSKILLKNQPLKKKRRPQVFSNVPICLNAKRLFKPKKYEYSVQLKLQHIMLIQKIPEYSVVVIDEMPSFINQFNWDNKDVQTLVNEWITYARHYYDCHIILTAQSVQDVVVQIRRKLNHATWAYGMKKHLFGLFYTIRMCDIMVNDAIQTFSTTQLEENTKLHWGFFPPKGTYDTRCYSERTNNALEDPQNWNRFNKLKTNDILRVEKYISPFDDRTSEEQKKQINERIKKL